MKIEHDLKVLNEKRKQSVESRNRDCVTGKHVKVFNLKF